jgi:hypothetical protein
MRLRLLLSLSLAPILSIFAQQPIAAIPGDEPTIALYSRLAEHAGRLIPMLAQMKTEVWVAKGASETYVQQTTSVTVQLQAVQHDMRSLQQHPDALQEGMKALFRVQAFHRSLDSVLSGLRRYQNPALADLIVSVAGEDTPDLQQLENHLVEIAAQKDKEYTVVEREAQRCRGMLVREPVPAPRPIRKIP